VATSTANRAVGGELDALAQQLLGAPHGSLTRTTFFCTNVWPLCCLFTTLLFPLKAGHQDRKVTKFFVSEGGRGPSGRERGSEPKSIR
jgi:hypothetical protein